METFIERLFVNYIEEKQAKLAKSLGIEPEVNKPLVLDKPKSPILKGYVFLGIGILLIAFQMCFGVVRVSGPSMLPTLHDKDFMLISKYDRVDRFDIVVLKERVADNGPSKNIVKRVIGFGGDRVTVVDGQLFVNNIAYNEYYLDDANTELFKNVNVDITVPDDYLFVMGDNRDVSKDSRTVGSFKKSAVIGVKIN